MQFIKRPIVLLYKGYKSSVNYDGEPSVSNGIVYQLPSSHLLIHRVLAKLSNRVIALRSKLLQATALVCILILLTCPFHRVRIFRGRITLPRLAGLCDDAVPVVLHRYRVSFQNPARFRNHPEPGKALE